MAETEGKCNILYQQKARAGGYTDMWRFFPNENICLLLMLTLLNNFILVQSSNFTINSEEASKPLISQSALDVHDENRIFFGEISHPKPFGSTSKMKNTTTDQQQQQSIQSHSEALIIGTDSSTTPDSLQPRQTDSNNNYINYNEDALNDGMCTLRPVSRRSLLTSISSNTGLRPVEVAERALNCSNVDHLNYRQMVKSIHKRNKSNIQQIHLSNSETFVIFSAIDLICDRFNCSKLTVFNLTGQEIHDSSVLSSWISSWPQLEVLDLSNTTLNTIESIFQVNAKSSKALNNLSSLILDNNNIVKLDFNYLYELMPNLRHISLSNNSIYNIECNETLKSRVKSKFETIGLANNTINCDKSQLWLIKQFLNPQTSIKFPDYDQIKCGFPERLIEMTWSQRVSVLGTPICDECDCKSLKRTAISVDCHNKNLKVLPDVLPLNTKILNLTSNQIHSIGVPQNSKNWENVTYVYLENNLITHFQPLEINSKFMRNLAALDIRRNKFQEFPSHIFEQFINLDQVHLSNNPWLCDCESTFAFQEWLQRQFQKVGDKEDIVCGISGTEENGLRSNSLQQRLSARVIYRLSKSELCPQDSLEEPCDWLDIANFILSITIVLILAKVTLDYIYQRRTKRLPRFFKLNL